jgi:hypothetical protein
MPRVGFETMIPVFGRAKTVRALERAATAIGKKIPLFRHRIEPQPSGRPANSSVTVSQFFS